MDLRAHDTPLPVLTRRAALDAGCTPYQLRLARTQGDVDAPAHGLLQRPGPFADGEAWELLRDEHLRRTRVHLARFPGHAASHQTAAIIHGLRMLLHPDMPVHLTSIDRAPRSRKGEGLQLHHCDSLDNVTEVIDGLRVTTLARTLADVLRTSRPPHGVAALDEALRQELVSDDAVWEVIEGQARWLGRPRAVEAFGWRDPTRESWLESYSFITLAMDGLALPVPQVEILDGGFHFVARVDGLDPTCGVFFEADGAGKYLVDMARGLSAEESDQRARQAEAERHRPVEELGLRGVRWTSAEIMGDPEAVLRRVRGVLSRKSADAFRGWVRYGGQVMGLSDLARQTSASHGAAGRSAT